MSEPVIGTKPQWDAINSTLGKLVANANERRAVMDEFIESCRRPDHWIDGKMPQEAVDLFKSYDRDMSLIEKNRQQ